MQRGWIQEAHDVHSLRKRKSIRFKTLTLGIPKESMEEKLEKLFNENLSLVYNITKGFENYEGFQVVFR